jgi:hypothetical protein
MDTDSFTGALAKDTLKLKGQMKIINSYSLSFLITKFYFFMSRLKVQAFQLTC